MGTLRIASTAPASTVTESLAADAFTIHVRASTAAAPATVAAAVVVVAQCALASAFALLLGVCGIAHADPVTIPLAAGGRACGTPTELTVFDGQHGEYLEYACDDRELVSEELAPTPGTEQLRHCLARLDDGGEAGALALFSGPQLLWALEAGAMAGIAARAQEVVGTGLDLREVIVTEADEDGAYVTVFTWRQDSVVRVFGHAISGGQADPGFQRELEFTVVRGVPAIVVVAPGRRGRREQWLWDAATFAFVRAPSRRPARRPPSPARASAR